jgi:hypothetical protein
MRYTELSPLRVQGFLANLNVLVTGYSSGSLGWANE